MNLDKNVQDPHLLHRYLTLRLSCSLQYLMFYEPLVKELQETCLASQTSFELMLYFQLRQRELCPSKILSLINPANGSVKLIELFVNTFSKVQRIPFDKPLATYAYSELPKRAFHHFFVIYKTHLLVKYLVQHANPYYEYLISAPEFLIYQSRRYGSAYLENILPPSIETNRQLQNLNHHDRRKLLKYPF